MLILKRISVISTLKSTRKYLNSRKSHLFLDVISEKSCSVATTAVACKLPEIQMRVPEIKMRVNPNSFGPLANLPDYSYMDGRPTPMGVSIFDFITV